MRIVMTGATSGIGLVAALRLVARPGAQLLAGTRKPNAAPELKAAGATIIPLDLASLAGTRAFAERAASVGPIDALVLNAGLQSTKPALSQDGFELTFAANHLAHHLLVRLLLPYMAEHGRIILTASGTHDPAERTGMPPPHHADADLLAYPERDPQRDRSTGTACRRAYSTSKLCNIMTARELAKRAADRPRLMVAAFDPGYVPATGLARDYPAPVRFIARHVVSRLLGSERVSTPEVSGGHLAALAVADDYAVSRGDYWSVRAGALKRLEPSHLARDEAAAARLWEASERLADG